MLILSRCKNEQIVITPPGCEPIVVTLIEIRGGTVRIGFEADKDTVVNRREVQDKLDANHKSG